MKNKYTKVQGFMYKTGSLLPLILMVSIIFILYGVYMGTYLVPLLQGTYFEAPIPQSSLAQLSYLSQWVSWNDKVFKGFYHQMQANGTKGIIIAMIIHPLLFLLLISIWRVVRSDAGRVSQEWIESINEEIHLYIQNENVIINECKQQKKDNIFKKTLSQTTQDSEKIMEVSRVESSIISELDEDLKSELNLRAKLELIDKQGYRFCKNCSAFKPERAHHCRQCKTCLMKMDHHCQWLNNCIGLRNYKIFINLIVYAQLLLLIMTLTYTRCYYDAMQRNYLADWELFIIIFNYYFTVLFFVLVTGFVIFHLWFEILLYDQFDIQKLDYPGAL